MSRHSSHHSWFQDARFGMFIHWGSYSLKGFEASWPLIYGDIAYADYDALADRLIRSTTTQPPGPRLLKRLACVTLS